MRSVIAVSGKGLFSVGSHRPRVAGQSPGPGVFGVLGELYEPHLAIVLCVGTFGGCHLGVECGAEWLAVLYSYSPAFLAPSQLFRNPSSPAQHTIKEAVRLETESLRLPTLEKLREGEQRLVWWQRVESLVFALYAAVDG